MDRMTDELEPAPSQVSGRDVAAELAASGALDELFAKIDSGQVEMTGAEGLIPGLIKAALERSGVAPGDVQLVHMGMVLPAAVGQAPARQAALGAGLPQSVPCVTVNKVCGSGLMAVALAAQAIRLGEANAIAAGGMESMSNAPYLLPQARGGQRLGHGVVLDAMIVDGLWDPYDDFHMGSAAERCGATARVWRSGARPRWQDVTTAQDCSGAAAVAGGRPGDCLARAGRHGGNAHRLARRLPGGR